MKLTKEQGVIITGFTGVLACDFSDFHADIERRMGRPVWTHEMSNAEFMEHMKELYRTDFVAIASSMASA